MRPECLTFTTPYDPAEDPPGSIDPLGTVAGAEPRVPLPEGLARELTFDLARWKG